MQGPYSFPFPEDVVKGEDFGGGRPNLGSTSRTTEQNRDDCLRLLGRVLCLRDNGSYRTPVVTLHNTESSNLYNLLERCLRPEYGVGAERWWKVRSQGMGSG